MSESFKKSNLNTQNRQNEHDFKENSLCYWDYSRNCYSGFSLVYGAIYTIYFADTGNYFMTAVTLTCLVVFVVAGVVLTFYEPIVRNAFIAGANWQKAQMEKEAVGAKIGSFQNGEIYNVDFNIDSNLQDEDKVKLIILKQ